MLQLFQRRHIRHLVASTLLASRSRDALPMCDALGSTLAGQANHTAPTIYRHDIPDAQLNGFLDGEIHLVTGLKRLHQRNRETRFALDIAPGTQLDDHPLALDTLNARFILAATAIKQNDGRPRRQAQNTHGMARHRLRQINVSAGREGLPAIKAG